MKFLVVLLVSSVCVAQGVMAKSLSLAATPFPTYVDNEGEPARLNDIVSEAFRRMGTDVELQVMRQAFLGSGLLSGELDGEFAALELDEKRSQALYSASYLPVYLYAVSKQPDVRSIRLLPHLQDARVAIENRFANTSRFRQVKEVKWSRNPTTYDAFKQLADDRAPLLLAPHLLVDEFNRLLLADNEELLEYSAAPLVTTGYRLALNASAPKAETLINDFNNTIKAMQRDGTYNRLLHLAWLTKDIDGDGIADYIVSSAVGEDAYPAIAKDAAFALDSTKPGEQSRYYVDGKQVDSAQTAVTLMPVKSTSRRDSLLDKEIYARMIQRW